MTNAISKQSTDTLAQLVNPYQLQVAQELSRAMADNQALELLATDTLYKIGSLAVAQAEVLKNNPEAQAYTDYVMRAFTYYATQKMK